MAQYDNELHHNSHLAVGVPGTVAGLHLAWKEQGKLPWKRLVDPAVALARDGFLGVATALAAIAEGMCSARCRSTRRRSRQFTKSGVPYEAGETLKQPDLARTLERIAAQGPAGFYEGETALLHREGDAGARRPDHARRSEELQAVRRAPVTGTYRGYEVIAMPPPTSGGVALDRDAERARGLRPQGRRAPARPRPFT